MSEPEIVEVDETLPVKYQVFVEAYLASNFNGPEAAIAAGYSPKSAPQQSSRLLKNAKIARAIQQKLDKALEPYQVKRDEVLALLVSHMRGSFKDFLDVSDGTIDFEKADKAEKLHLIRKVRSRATTIINGGNDTETHIVESEIEMYDAQAAAVQLGKHLDLFNNKIDITMYGNLKELPEDKLLKLSEGKTP